MANWKLTPKGDLINFDRVERITICDDHYLSPAYIRDRAVKIETDNRVFWYEFNDEWRNFLKILPEELSD